MREIDTTDPSKLHIHQNSRGFELLHDDRLVSSYWAEEEIPRTEFPKPCFARIYTPSGTLITDYRPADHLWHTGLYFGWVHVNDANFWGGPWYVPEAGKYLHVSQIHGVQRHDRFRDVQSEHGSVAIIEELTWLDQRDQPIVAEERYYQFDLLDETPGYLWIITTKIAPIVDAVTFGASKASGYSGLVLRMGPPFADATHRSSEGLVGHEQIMGTRGRWVSATGAAGGSVIMMDHPRNPRYPVTWFTRSNLLEVGLLMDGPMEIKRRDPLVLNYGFAVTDQNMDQPLAEMLHARFVEAMN